MSRLLLTISFLAAFSPILSMDRIEVVQLDDFLVEMMKGMEQNIPNDTPFYRCMKDVLKEYLSNEDGVDVHSLKLNSELEEIYDEFICAIKKANNLSVKLRIKSNLMNMEASKSLTIPQRKLGEEDLAYIRRIITVNKNIAQSEQLKEDIKSILRRQLSLAQKTRDDVKELFPIMQNSYVSGQFYSPIHKLKKD